MSSTADGTWVRVCPDCDAEFVATVESCFDCGTALETRPADPGVDPAAVAVTAAAPAAAPGAETEPPPGWVPIQTADLDWAIELKDRLAGAGIAARLARDCASCRPTLGVYVSPEDLAAAHRVAQAIYVEKVPAAAEAPAEPPAADRCPACGGAVAETAPECPECGLSFVPPDADES